MLELDPAVIKESSFITLYNKRPIGLEIPYSESYLIPSSATIRLREVPKEDSPSTVIITGYAEVVYPPSTGQFSVFYDTGEVVFHSSAIGTTIAVTYNGKGSRVFAADINKITVPLTPFYNKLDGIVPNAPSTPIFTFPNNVIINGDLDVKGTTTTIESVNVTVKDPVMTLNYGVVAPGNNSGFEIDRGSGNPKPNLKWIEADSAWEIQGTSLTNALKIDNLGNLTVLGFVTVGTLLKYASYTDTTEATLVAGLSAGDAGVAWFNSTSSNYKGFNGTAVVILG